MIATFCRLHFCGRGLRLVASTAILAAAIGCVGTAVGQTFHAFGGMTGYLSMYVYGQPEGYGYGVSFYSAAWPLTDSPINGFQIGLPSTWVTPDNRDFNEDLCGPGTLASTWSEGKPNHFRDVFQTIEGGMGFWNSTRFPAKVPKYRINGVPNCYERELSTPGWAFVDGGPKNERLLADNEMGIAQLSNRILIPPDGMTLNGTPNGEFLGFAWMAMPLRPPKGTIRTSSLARSARSRCCLSPYTPVGRTVPTGNHSWTLFLNSTNFKGPVAYWIADTWSEASMKYRTIVGRGLDARPARIGSGAMEFGQMAYYEGRDASTGVSYSRVPLLHFPADRDGNTVLMRDVRFYSPEALFSNVGVWINGGSAPRGMFQGGRTPNVDVPALTFTQRGLPIRLTSLVESSSFPGASYGLKWKQASGAKTMPEYFKEENGEMVPVSESQVPDATGLKSKTFIPATRGEEYVAPVSTPNNAWSYPGPASQPIEVKLADNTRVTYVWYRFVDQPALQHLKLNNVEKQQLQSTVEKMHDQWKHNRDYIPPPASGKLVTMDPALIVQPPHGMEKGYVPIVIRQRQEPEGGED